MIDTMLVFTINQSGLINQLYDASAVQWVTREYGHDLLQFKLFREWAFAWADFGFNYQVIVRSCRGDIAFWGRIDTIQQKWTLAYTEYDITVAGHWFTTFDLTTNGSITGTTPEACLKTLLSNTYLPSLSTTQTGIYTTGVTSFSYQTGNGGTDDVHIGDIINQICAYGDSSGNKVVAYVDNTAGTDSKPLLQTKAINTASPTADYMINKYNVTGFDMTASISNVYTRIIARYKDSVTQAVARQQKDDTTSQSQLAEYLGAAAVNFIRTGIIDMSGLSNGTTSTIAGNTAQARLNATKRIKRSASQAIVIDQQSSVLSTATLQYLPLWQVHAGMWIQIIDFYPRINTVASGNPGADYFYNTIFYILETRYDATSGTLSITPEQSNTLDNVTGGVNAAN